VGADEPAESHGTTLRLERLLRIGDDPNLAPNVFAVPDGETAERLSCIHLITMARARHGDAFRELTEPYRREL
jgi:hypothetical protein